MLHSLYAIVCKRAFLPSTSKGFESDVKLLPYSWKLYKQVKGFGRGLTEKDHFQYLKKIGFEKRKGPQLPLSQLAK